MSTEKLNFSEQLKKYRKQLGYSQRQMSIFLGFSIKSIQAWEQQQRTPPKTYKEMILQKIKREIKIQNFGKLKEE